MVVLIDTNIILDMLVKRQPYLEAAIKIVNLCTEKIIRGCLAAHTVSNLFYILRKEYSVTQRREMLMALCRVFEISEINGEKIAKALKNDQFEDFEDCLQDECAASLKADYIVTRNTKDFTNSKVPAIQPEEFLKLF